MSALERMEANKALAHRSRLLDNLTRTVNANKILNYAQANDLPEALGRWSTEQLEIAHRALTGSAKSSGGTTMTPAKGAKRFLITFPNGKPGKATYVVLEGDEPQAAEGTTQVVVSAQDELKGLATPTLLAIVNAGQTTPIRKFTSDDAAVEAAWHKLVDRAAPPPAKKAPRDETPKQARPVNYPAKDAKEIKQVRTGTKVATAIDLLSQKDGVLLSELEAKLSATGKPVSARSWLGYDVSKVVGYGVRSEPVDGDITDLRVYLVLPKGMKTPLAHKAADDIKKPTPAKKADKETAPAQTKVQTAPAAAPAAKPAAKKGAVAAAKKAAVQKPS